MTFHVLKMMVGAITCVMLITVYSASAKTAKLNNPCYCAAMNSSDPADKQVERAIQLSLPCNDKGDEDCKRLCVALANSTAADPQGKEKFCNYYGKEGRIYVNVFSKVCDRPYMFTGVANKIPVCCKEKKEIPCAA